MNLIDTMPDPLIVFVVGFAATVTMTTILYGSQRAGISRLSLPFLVGTCMTPSRSKAHRLGFFSYLIGGWLFAFFYVALLVLIGASWWIGGLVGLVHGLFLLTVLLPSMPYFHPRMASEYDGPSETRRLQPPGFLGLNYGYRTPISTLIAHVSYGVVLGAFIPG